MTVRGPELQPAPQQTGGKIAALFGRMRQWNQDNMPMPWDTLSAQRQSLEPLHSEIVGLSPSILLDSDTRMYRHGLQREYHRKLADILSKHATYLEEHKPVLSGIRRALTLSSERRHRRWASKYTVSSETV